MHFIYATQLSACTPVCFLLLFAFCFRISLLTALWVHMARICLLILGNLYFMPINKRQLLMAINRRQEELVRYLFSTFTSLPSNRLSHLTYRWQGLLPLGVTYQWIGTFPRPGIYINQSTDGVTNTPSIHPSIHPEGSVTDNAPKCVILINFECACARAVNHTPCVPQMAIHK